MPINRNIQFSDETQAIISSMPRSAAVWGGSIVLGLLVVFLTLASVIHYPQTLKTVAFINYEKPQNTLTDTSWAKNTEGGACQLLIPEMSINRIKKGQIALIDWDNQSLPKRGFVNNIKPMTGTKDYLACITFEKENVDVTQSLPTRVAGEIIIQEHRLIEYLIQPVRLFLERQRQKQLNEHKVQENTTPQAVKYTGQ